MKSTSAVTALVAARIWPIRRPQGTALPAISYRRLDGATVNGSTGPTTTEYALFEVNCWEDDYGDCQALAAVVKAALNGYTAASGDPQISSCLLTNEQDLPEAPEPGQDLQTHRVLLEFKLWYNAAP